MKRLGVLAAVLALLGCGLSRMDAPTVTGPSELGLAISLTATPDTITQDGSSQSVVEVVARDALAQPLRGVTLRLEIFVNGVQADFGTLASRTLSTGVDGRASTIYTAPPAPPPTAQSDTLVRIAVTPVSTDFANDSQRAVLIKVVRPATVAPPPGPGG